MTETASQCHCKEKPDLTQMNNNESEFLSPARVT